MYNRSYIQNIGPEFCVRGCDRACEGYIISEDTKQGSYILYIGPVSILYTIYCMMACIVYTEWSDRSILKNIDHLLGLYTIYRPHHIKRMMSPSY